MSVALVMLLLLTAMAAMPSDAAPKVEGPFKMGTGDTATFTISTIDEASFLAEMPGGAVDPAEGVVDGEKELQVTAPDSAGEHTLKVTFTYEDGSERVLEWKVDVFEPYVFTAELFNEGSIAVEELPVKFILNGEVIHQTKVDMDAGEERTVEYRHVSEPLGEGRQTITVTIDPDGEMVVLSSGSTSMTSVFYIGQDDHSLANWIMGLTLVIMSFALVWVYRKPKKNLGRPRGRR